MNQQISQSINNLVIMLQHAFGVERTRLCCSLQCSKAIPVRQWQVYFSFLCMRCISFMQRWKRH